MKTALRYFLLMTALLGIAYPLLITGVAQFLFSEKANGSLIQKENKVIGSALIAQAFKNPRYFWPRPSAVDCNPASSGASNLSPTSADLQTKITERKGQGMDRELLFASGSGLDPHISPEAAIAQIDRIVKARAFDETKRRAIIQLVELNTEKRQFGFLGEPRINVLRVNLALDNL